eukprot:scaffold16895_cov77-Isochrysis_galbana.AAC.2
MGEGGRKGHVRDWPDLALAVEVGIGHIGLGGVAVVEGGVGEGCAEGLVYGGIEDGWVFGGACGLES